MSSPYGTLDAANFYHAARGNTAWGTSTGPQREIALLRGSEYVDGTRGARFVGTRAEGLGQPREWPRVDAVDIYGGEVADTATPERVEHAAYEAALRELVAPGSLSPDVVPGTIRKRVKVDGAVEVEYFGARGAEDMAPVLSVIDRLLYPLLRSATSPLSGEASRG